MQAQEKNTNNIGKITQVIGPVVDVEFRDGVLPQIQGGGGTSFLIDTRDTARPQQGAAK